MTSNFSRVIFNYSSILLKRTDYRLISSCQKVFCVAPESAALLSQAEKQFHEQIESLLKEKETIAEKLADIQDKYVRTLADRENLRTRLERQIKDAKQFGIQGFCKDLLEVSDVFRKAIESVPIDKVNTGHDDLKTLYSGVVITEAELLSVFRRNGLLEIKPGVGDKFDPTTQEAVFELALQDQEPGTVATVIRSGWLLHERCIRSAQVGVVKYR